MTMAIFTFWKTRHQQQVKMTRVQKTRKYNAWSVFSGRFSNWCSELDLWLAEVLHAAFLLANNVSTNRHFENPCQKKIKRDWWLQLTICRLQLADLERQSLGNQQIRNFIFSHRIRIWNNWKLRGTMQNWFREAKVGPCISWKTFEGARSSYGSIEIWKTSCWEFRRWLQNRFSRSKIELYVIGRQIQLACEQ